MGDEWISQATKTVQGALATLERAGAENSFSQRKSALDTALQELARAASETFSARAEITMLQATLLGARKL